MGYKYFIVAEANVDQARIDYTKVIWQDEIPRGFGLKFTNNENSVKIYAHVARLDQDQQDWILSLPGTISVSPGVYPNEGDAMDALIEEMQARGYHLQS